MAEVKRTNDPKQDLREKQGSIFKTAAVSAPVAVGGGIGISRLLKSSSHFSQPIQRVNTNRSDAIRRFANRYVNPEHAGVFKEWQLDKLAGFSDNTALSVEHVRSAMTRAAASVDPSGILSSMFDKRLAFAQTGQQAYKDIMEIMRSNSSIYTEKAVRRFIDDTSLLEERATAGLPIEVDPFDFHIKRRKVNLTYGELDPVTRAEVAKMEQLTGTSVKIREVSRTDLPGSAELHLKFTQPGEKQSMFDLRIPREIKGQPGVVSRGATQQSRYLAGQYMVLEGDQLVQSFNHEQWMARRATEELIPQVMAESRTSQRAVNDAVHLFEQRMIEDPEWVATLDRGKHAGLDTYTDLRSQIARLYTRGDDGNLRRLNEFELAKVIEKGGVLPSGQQRMSWNQFQTSMKGKGLSRSAVRTQWEAYKASGGRLPLFPAHSPAQIAKAAASTIDPRASQLVPSAVKVGRRPFQRYRVGFTPTTEALDAMAASEVNQRFAWAADAQGVRTPMLRTAFVSSSLEQKLTPFGVSAEGQFLVSTARANELAVQELGKLDVAAKSSVELGKILGDPEAGYWKLDRTLPKDTFLGYGPDDLPVSLQEDTFVSEARAFKDVGKGEYIRLSTMKTIERPRYAKFFGIKGMGVFTSPDYIGDVLTKGAGVSQYKDKLFRGIDAVVTMDELVKQPSQHYAQMFTALWDFTNQNMQGRKGFSQMVSNFAASPTKTIAQMEAAALGVSAGSFSHEKMIEQMGALARDAKLTPTQMGQTFGALPEAFDGKYLSALGKLSVAEAQEISRGVVVGATQMYFGGRGGSGAGNVGTIEPRMLELLGSQHFGTLGPELQEDIKQRMIAAYPERLKEQGILNRALTSLNEPSSQGTKALSLDEMRRQMRKGILPATENYVRLPGGLGDLYVPGSGDVSQLAAYKTAGGSVVQPDLAMAYKNTLDVAKKYQDRDITIEVLNQEVDKLRSQINSARLATVTGKGGLMRGRLPGSRSLTAVQPTAAEQLGQRVAGISDITANKMFSSMEQLGIYDEKALASMRSRFEAGEKLPGLVMRHPGIGPHSTQASWFQRVEGASDEIMMSRNLRRGVAMRGQLAGQDLSSFAMGAEKALAGDAWAIQRAKTIGAEVLGSPLDLSAFPGAAADVDGDTFNAVFASPKLEESMRSHLTDPEAQALHRQHAIRSQVLKAKAAGNEISLRKAMAGDIYKLGITESGRLGKLSTELQQYRASVMGGGLPKQKEYAALGLLEWLEQGPISGKHIAPGREEAMIYSLSDLQLSLRKQAPTEMADAVRSILSNAKPTAQAALREGFTWAMENPGTGGVTTEFIPGLDIASATEGLVDSRQAAEMAGPGGLSASEMRQMSFGRARMSPQQMMQFSDPRNLGLSPFGDLFHAGAGPGRFAEFAGKALSLSNRLGAAGQKMLAHARPLAIGSAVGLGMATLLSEPPRAMAMGAAAPPTPDLRSGSGGAALTTNIHPSAQVSGMPTAQTMVDHNNTARITSPSSLQSEGYTVNIHGSMAGMTDHKQLTAQLQAAMGRGARVNSVIRDQRSSLTPQKLSSMLQD